MADWASEAGHWYDEAGEPRYEVEKAKGGGLRPTTLRDARKLKLYPSVTSVMREIATPALTTWKAKEAVKASLTIERYPGETEDQFAMRSIGLVDQYVKERAGFGSQVHGALEQAMLGEEFDPNFLPHWHAVESLLAELGTHTWLAEKSFAETTIGYGGKVDAHCAEWVIDFKTKEFDADKLPAVYENHWMQLSAYREGLCVPKARGMIIYVSINNPGLIHPVEVKEDDLVKGYEMFKCLHQLWCVRRGYYPNAA